MCGIGKKDSGGTAWRAKLYIGGLSYSTTSETLREFFAQSGNVQSATVITDRFSGQSRGFGFVEMATTEEAQNAISQLNGRELDGRRITVEISNPQAARPGGGGRARWWRPRPGVAAAAGPAGAGQAAGSRRERLRPPPVQTRQVVAQR